MGYTTDFDGVLHLSRPLTVPEFNELKKLGEEYEKKDYAKVNPEHPDSYLQWVPTKDGEGLEWNGGEKFYDYVEWLEWLIKYWFTPKNIELNGAIRWQGEEIGDVGRIEVNHNTVKAIELEVTGVVECPECGERFVPNE